MDEAFLFLVLGSGMYLISSIFNALVIPSILAILTFFSIVLINYLLIEKETMGERKLQGSDLCRCNVRLK